MRSCGMGMTVDDGVAQSAWTTGVGAASVPKRSAAPGVRAFLEVISGAPRGLRQRSRRRRSGEDSTGSLGAARRFCDTPGEYQYLAPHRDGSRAVDAPPPLKRHESGACLQESLRLIPSIARGLHGMQATSPTGRRGCLAGRHLASDARDRTWRSSHAAPWRSILLERANRASPATLLALDARAHQVLAWSARIRHPAGARRTSSKV